MTIEEKLKQQNQIMLNAITKAIDAYYDCDDNWESTHYWRIATQELEETLQNIKGQQS
jgi:hypothetical protein